jgi:hypothetical protein
MNLIDRAKAAKCSALVLTPTCRSSASATRTCATVFRRRRNDACQARHLADGDTPRWCLDMRQTKRRTFGNIVGHAKNVSDLSSLSSWTRSSSTRSCPGSRCRLDQGTLGRQADHQGHLDKEDAKSAAEDRRRRDHRLQPRRPPARRRPLLDQRCLRSSTRSATRSSAYGWRHPLRPGRAESRGARRQGHLYRPALPLRPRRHGQGRRNQSAGTSSARRWTSRWPSAASATSTRSTPRSSPGGSRA